MSQRLILGSSSPRRLEILRMVGIEPDDIASPDIDETPLKSELPKNYAYRMAFEKAEKLSAQYDSCTILTADTVTSCGRRILPKALTEQDERYCLNLLSGRRHKVYTGFCVVTPDKAYRTKVVTTIVKFKHLSTEEIRWFIKHGDWYGTAGGCTLQGKAARFIKWISGSHHSVVGLPIYEVVHALRSTGFKV